MPIEIERELDRLRENLLDLTLRNSLLNYRKSRAKTLQIVDEVPDFIFNRLVRDRKNYRFQPMEQQEQGQLALADEADPPEDSQQLELPSASTAGTASQYRDNRLQTNVTAEKLDSLLKGLQRAAKTAIEETGINYLHLAIGFLSWKRADDSSAEYIAPLILIPVSIEKKFDAGQGEYIYEVSWTEEEIQHNLCLERFLKQEFGTELPKYADGDDDDEPESYFNRVAHSVRRFKDWSVKREALLGFFSFHKLLMYADLDPKNWKGTGALGDDSLVSKIISGHSQDSSSPMYASEYDVEEDETAKNMRLLTDADSSQHSALVDIALGRHVVIEGPPGTGKSQTITNAIATAIHSGKSVLFVAEKIAALKVVHDRLSAYGLGDFCLELHSDSSSARSVMESLAKRLTGSRKEPQQLALVEQKLQSCRDELKRYLSATSRKMGPRYQPLYELFWRVVDLKSQGYEALYGANLDLNVVEPHFEQNLSLLRIVASTLNELPNPYDSPWWGFRVNRLRGRAHIEIVEIIRRLTEVQQNWSDTLAKLNSAFSQPNAVWMRMAEQYDGRLEKLGHQLATTDVRLVSRLLHLNNRLEAASFVGELQDTRLLKREITQQLLVNYEDAVNNCRDLAPCISRNSLPLYGSFTTGQLLSYGSWLATTSKLVSELQESASKLAALGLGNPRNLREFDGACVALRLVRHPIVADRSHVHPNLFLANAVDKVRTAFKQSQSLQQQRSSLEEKFHIPSVPSTEALETIAKRIRPHVRSFFRIFNKDYRKASAELKQFWRPGIGKKPEQWVSALESMAAIGKKVDDFNGSKELIELLGTRFRGIESDWDQIKQLLDWVATCLKNGLDFHTLATIFERHDTDPNSISTRVLLEQSKQFLSQLTQQMMLPLGLNVQDVNTIGFADLASRLRTAAEALAEAQMVFELFRVDGTETYASVAAWADKINVTAEKERNLQDNRWGQLLSPFFDGMESNIEALQTAIDCAEAVIDSVEQPDVRSKVLEGNATENCLFLHQQLDSQKQSIGEWSHIRSGLASYGKLDDAWLDLSTFAISPESLFERLEQLIDNVDQLPILATLNLNLEACERASLNSFTDALLRGVISQSDIAPVYELTVLEAIAENEIDANPDLSGFSRSKIEMVREQFKDYDRKLLELNRSKLAYDIERFDRTCPAGVSSGRVAEYSEMGLIRHEIRKQRRFCRIRDLLQRAAVSIRALKPCFMMSPLSVAQFVAPGSIEFDLVIMDEASQIRPEDAIGALLRSKQMVVVGDPKQLPPTSFFDRQQDEVDEEAAVVIDNTESILEASLKTFQPVRRLRWHYRSKHESLIQFSNSRFYDGDLVVFPSATLENGTLGVTFKHVQKACFEDGCNLKEAKAIAKAVVQHALDFPDDTIGVGAFNLKQSQVISDFIDKECEKNADIRKAVERLNAGAEGLFVKNLENLQGDERDVIFISYTYGPDKVSGRVMNRFGPINSDSGWRRLNVLVTRARKSVKLFASMLPSDINIGPTASRGVIAFRDYLEFAQSGRLPERELTDRDPESPFERSVARVITSLGYKAVPQVGVAGYFVDIGVQFRQGSSDFILGIECDGATYHSSKSARDRDRLREEVIRSRGWELHRIWSTDWFQNREHEEQRLQNAIASALK